ncbi:serine hydrolase domain-containing protein [Paenibacillus sp. PL91]|uniref:serine hydrolase domain-containing protein n=1 Tax=Paenibacillus sp. PL91 TaxID=2729538 RepID=UPI00145E7617|nr:serine hydrolase domain-containing protein [Paenibacillus sp. PL91]MBC9204012.1 beta-lactamase family protein [Paenibacillus sp. PL91]
MKKSISRILAAVLVLTLLVPAGAMAAGQSGGPAYEDTRKAAAEKAALLTDTFGTTSVQFALIDHGSIVVSGQSGRNDEKGKQPLTAKTMYGIGSTSKMFVTAAVMKLADEGKVNLDKPVINYIPEFTMKDERYKQITPRMLLNHSAGLIGSTLTNAFLFEDNDTYAHDSLLDQLANQKLKADPGAFSVYCNDCFTLAEILVEKVSGMDYTSFIHKHFTEPLGMSDTKTPLDQPDVSGMAGLYFPSYKEQLPNESVNVIGTGGIYSTAEDLARFSQIFTGQATGTLSEESVKAMEQEEYKKGLWPEEADTSVSYGLGWDSVTLFPFGDYGIKALTKGGDTILYHASLVVLPEHNMAAAVLSSGGSSTTNQLLANDMLLHALKEKGIITEFKPEKSYGKPTAAQMPQELLKNAGLYGMTSQLIKADIGQTGEMTLSYLQMPDYPAEKYVYTADGSFVSADGNTKVSFVTEENGRTYLWTRQYIAIPGLGQTALSHYSAEKLASHDIPEETAAAWIPRDGKKYYPINEKYTSVAYMIIPALQVNLSKEAPGYISDKKIIGPNAAFSDLQIPAMNGRDTSDYNFFTQDGTEYLEVAGNLFVHEDAVKPVYPGQKSSVTIQASGHAKWYTLSEKTAGKTLKVKMPTTGSFAIYDEKGTCTFFSIISRDQKVVLPEKGTLVFAGETGTKFELSLK